MTQVVKHEDETEVGTDKDKRVMQTITEMLTDRGYYVKDQVKQGQPYEHLKRTLDNKPETIYAFYEQDDGHNNTGGREKRLDTIKHFSNCRIIYAFDKLPNKTENEQYLKMLQTNKVYIEIFESRRLLFNVTKHVLVPKHQLLDIVEKEIVLNQLKARESQLQTISLTDPIAKYYGARVGEVFMITRVSEFSAKFINYRVCVDK